MDNLDLSLFSIVIILLPLLLSMIPPIIICVAGVLAVKKGFEKAGIAIVVSSVLSIILYVGNTLAIRFAGPQWYGLIFGYISQAAGLLSGGLLAGGVLGLILHIPAASTFSSSSTNK